MERYTRAVPYVVALDEETMRLIGTKAGKIVEVQGDKNKTLARVMPLYPVDSGKKIARIDEYTRKEAQIEVGGKVKIRGVDVPTATKVFLTPLNLMPSCDERYLSKELDGMPLTKGSQIVVPFFGERWHFKVMDVVLQDSASGLTGIVDEKTEFLLKSKIS